MHNSLKTSLSNSLFLKNQTKVLPAEDHLNSVPKIKQDKKKEVKQCGSVSGFDLISELNDVFEAIVQVNELGRIIKVNKTFIDMLGYSADELNRLKWEDCVFDEDIQKAIEAHAEMNREGKAKAELRLTKKDGSICFIKARLVKNRSNGNTFPGDYYFIEDITEIKQAQKSITDAQNFAVSTLNSITSNVAIIDNEGKILAVNRAWVAFSLQNNGDLKKTCVGSNYLDVCDKAVGKNSQQGTTFSEGIRKVLKGEKNEFVIKYPCHTPLHERWFVAKVSKFIGEGTRKAVILHDDITESTLAEMKLAKSEEKFRSMVQNSSDIITITDFNGKVKYVSPSVKKILGYEPKYGYGKSVFNLIHPDDLDKVKKAFEQNINHPNKTVTVDYWFRKSDGNYIYMESIVNNLLRDPNVQGMVVNTRNITDRKYAEEQIKATLNEKEILLKEIHHRVKNNLQIVSSLLKLQENHIPEKEFKKVFHDSITRVKAMSLIHQKLYQENSLSSINFGCYIKSIVQFLKETYDADERNIVCEIAAGQMNLNLETAVPCGLIINELISNALKHAFTENKGGKILVKLESKGNNIITISDNGIGFPNELIFGSAKTLGLSIVNTLAMQLKAKIDISVNNGTTFRVTFNNLVYKERIL
jgi:PAS domain S-box-containing protein